eukprot:359429-Chlamydomonas_euryale.AAC.3
MSQRRITPLTARRPVAHQDGTNCNASLPAPFCPGLDKMQRQPPSSLLPWLGQTLRMARARNGNSSRAPPGKIVHSLARYRPTPARLPSPPSMAARLQRAHPSRGCASGAQAPEADLAATLPVASSQTPPSRQWRRRSRPPRLTQLSRCCCRRRRRRRR